eukprot:scaffold1418_cov352-Prasinococcus_capsulatus_cf.AAC.3
MGSSLNDLQKSWHPARGLHALSLGGPHALATSSSTDVGRVSCRERRRMYDPWCVDLPEPITTKRKKASSTGPTVKGLPFFCDRQSYSPTG